VVVDKPLVAALLKLNAFDEFEPFRQWLQGKRDFWRDALETQKDEATLRQAQGRAQAYKEILELLADAPTLARKYGA
jgi:hypothetical protein